VKYLSFVDWETGDLAIRNLKTQEDKRITKDGTWDDPIHFALNNVISPDGEKIAYCWWNPNHTYDLRLIDMENPSPIILYQQEGEEVYPMVWLSRNELIITRYIKSIESSQVVSFNVLDKTLTKLRPFERRYRPQLSCSPDEKYIAYDYANKTNNGNWDINLLTKDGVMKFLLLIIQQMIGCLAGCQEERNSCL